MKLKQSIKKIQNSANEAAKADLEKQMAKLQDVKNVNTPSEGFVFDYNGHTYKFTGNFAPVNQIIGMFYRSGTSDKMKEKKVKKESFKRLIDKLIFDPL